MSMHLQWLWVLHHSTDCISPPTVAPDNSQEAEEWSLALSFSKLNKINSELAFSNVDQSSGNLDRTGTSEKLTQ